MSVRFIGNTVPDTWQLWEFLLPDCLSWLCFPGLSKLLWSHNQVRQLFGLLLKPPQPTTLNSQFLVWILPSREALATLATVRSFPLPAEAASLLISPQLWGCHLACRYPRKHTARKCSKLGCPPQCPCLLRGEGREGEALERLGTYSSTKTA